MRINKFLAQLGFGSRREVDDLISQGLVLLNGKKAELGYQLQDGDKLEYKGQHYTFQVSKELKKHYYAFNKAKGLVCTCARDEKDNIIDFLEQKYPKLVGQRLFPVGRLDKDSRGLLILTNDGDLTQKLTHPKYEHEKKYLVTCKQAIDDDFISRFQKGIKIREEDEDSNFVITKPCRATMISGTQFSCVLEQGYNRQIRKMVQVLNNEVVDLYRVKIARLELPEIKENQLIELTGKQLKLLY